MLRNLNVSTAGSRLLSSPAVQGPPPVTIDASQIPKIRWITFAGNSRVVSFEGTGRVISFDGTNRTIPFN
jgi:hypothetical protein